MNPADFTSGQKSGDSGADQAAPSIGRHHAQYLLERGVWRVTCRTCGWQAENRVRRQLATWFRFHLRTDVIVPPPLESRT